MKKQLLFILFPILTFSQIQIGQDIDGQIVNDESGSSVSLSSDGSIVAIGARYNDTNGNNSGQVRVYKFETNNWVQLGQDINGEAALDQSGFSISLSSDGSIVAIGAYLNNGVGAYSGHVRVYRYETNSWVQLGQDIDGEAFNDWSGYSVSISSDGSIVAIGAIYNSENGNGSGHVRVYQYITDNWVQLGQDINGEAASDKSGNSVSISSDGSIVAIGAYNNGGNGTNSGHVRVYKYETDNWVQLGQDIDGEASGDESGDSVSLSSDGSIVAIGAHFNAGNGVGSGHVRVYKYETDSWVQLGQDIDGDKVNDYSGYNVSLSSDGSIVAIGAPLNDGNSLGSGQVRLYRYETDSWNKIGTDIYGETSRDESGKHLSLSSDGSIVAIGAHGNDGNGSNSGHVRVYDLTAVLSTESFNQNYFSFYPNPVKDELNVELKKGLELNKINIYNVHSQYLYSIKELKIDTKNLTSGIYFIEVETNKGKSAKKIVIQ